ncbi:4491_t:CDS:2 [Funneliformis mosseae]|uniref:4491_t:CDS:1 n=1 Tax=Funneliformis mosseae TaxID=27381 RepID=A0A9N9FEG1_FUNMO|nr:4491_t:CDS:2 [Funneliformis mosseae]
MHPFESARTFHGIRQLNHQRIQPTSLPPQQQQQAAHTFSWTLRGFNELHRQMSPSNFAYSDRFHSPRGTHDPSLLYPPGWSDFASVFPSQQSQFNCFDDTAYLWRIRLYPNGSLKKLPSHISIYLEAIQTLFEKQRYITKRSVQFKIQVYRLLKSKNQNQEPSSTMSIQLDLWKENPILVYESNMLKFDYELQNTNTLFGIPSIGTFSNLFPNVDPNLEDVDVLVRIRIYNNNVTNNMITPYTAYYQNDFAHPEPIIKSPASFERFFDNETYYDVAFTFDNGMHNIKAHRIILSQRSEYFEKWLGNAWTGDGNMKVIPIKEIPFEAFRTILFYLYTLRLQDGLDFDVLKDIYSNADMMRLEQLTQLVADRIVHLVTLGNCHQVLDLAWNSNSYTSKIILKTVAYDFISKNWQTLRSTENIRYLICNAPSMDCIEELMDAKTFGVGK